VFKGPENKALRQALSYAIDKTSFAGPRALGPISPGSWAYNPLVKDYAYDVARARDLVENLETELRVNLATSPPLLGVAESIAVFWAELGVKTDVHVVSILPEEYDAFLAIYDVAHDPDQYALWHTTQTQINISKYSNPRIDKLLEDGRVELDFEERRRLYLDFQRFLLEDAPAVFLYHPMSYTITRK
jgi:peptide/nickel transport system substrate-binding protein